MGFWTLFEVASMPILQVLLISILGAFMATSYCNILTTDARKSLNKIVFIVFTPSLMFASLAKTVTFQDVISWWFMPVNIGLTFLIGGILGWIVVKLLKPQPHLEGLVIATCSSGNLGNLLLIVIPAICNEDGSPFDRDTCRSVGLSYASFSMALGGFFIWTYTYSLIRSSAAKLKVIEAAEEITKAPNNDLEASQETHLLKQEEKEHAAKSVVDTETEAVVSQEHGKGVPFLNKLLGSLHKILEELLAPPTLGAVSFLNMSHTFIDFQLYIYLWSFSFWSITFLRKLIVLGDNAPASVTGPPSGYKEHLQSSLWLVKGAAKFGFLPSEPLYQYVLMIQYTLPPAMNIGTMTQLFNVGQEECSVLFLWTYLGAALALTVWSTVFMWILS
ncbi:protein PIN-LIKES 5 [Jatropha curcas]|uniref:protein PIN-LIKES 5 n=1 Tax=Jatropha curcas TaxID=180498 RepID=UPI0018962CFE|nr:protein PIN-LIKES 5 [Jatropha curcas]